MALWQFYLIKFLRFLVLALSRKSAETKANITHLIF